jgi:hypothetical protein
MMTKKKFLWLTVFLGSIISGGGVILNLHAQGTFSPGQLQLQRPLPLSPQVLSIIRNSLNNPTPPDECLSECLQEVQKVCSDPTSYDYQLLEKGLATGCKNAAPDISAKLACDSQARAAGQAYCEKTLNEACNSRPCQEVLLLEIANLK